MTTSTHPCPPLAFELAPLRTDEAHRDGIRTAPLERLRSALVWATQPRAWSAMTLHTMLCVTLCALSTEIASAQTQITTPRGGWRYSESVQDDFLQEVHYPASSVNSAGKSMAALIMGRVAKHPKSNAADARKPARLVVDGVALPLLSDESGQFARPWSFGAGSHSIEVRDTNGERARTQFIEAQAARARSRIRVVLSWDSDSTDVDLHVISPDGQHVYFADRVAANGGALDVDVTTGFGPEIYATPNPIPGLYHVFVNYYGAGERRGIITTARIAVITDEGTPKEKQQLFSIPLRKPGELTLVRSFIYQ